MANAEQVTRWAGFSSAAPLSLPIENEHAGTRTKLVSVAESARAADQVRAATLATPAIAENQSKDRFFMSFGLLSKSLLPIVLSREKKASLRNRID